MKLPHRAAKLLDDSKIQRQKQQQQKKNCTLINKIEISGASKMLHIDSSTEVDGIKLCSC